MASFIAQFPSPKVTMWQGLGGFALAAVMLSFYALTIDTIKKLKNKDSVPDSSIKFLYTLSTIQLIISIIALLLFGISLFKLARS